MLQKFITEIGKIVFGGAFICALISTPAESKGTCPAGSEKGLVAYWNFDEGKGDTAHDISGEKWYYNNGTIHNPDWQEGVRGSCLLMGKDSYIEVPHSKSLELKDSFTFEAWVKPLSTKEKQVQVIFAKGSVTKDYAPVKDDEYCLCIQGQNVRCLSWSDEKAPVRVLAGNTHFVDLQENEWNFIAVTGDGRIARYYRNGKLYGIYPYSEIPAGTSPLYIGYDSANKTFLNAFVDEIKIYNSPLSSEAIRQHYGEIAGKDARDGGKKYSPGYVTHCKYVRDAVLRPDPVFDASGKPCFRENLHLYVRNPGKIPIEISKVIINETDLSEDGNVLWHVVNPPEIAGGGYGEITVRYMETGTAPSSFDLELKDSRGNIIDRGRIEEAEREPFIFRSIGFDDGLDTIYLYILPEESLKIKEILCNGVKANFRSQSPLNAGEVSPVVVRTGQGLKNRESVFIEVKTDRGNNCIISRASEPFFSIGMYRCYKSDGPAPKYREKYEREFGEKWGPAYLPTFRKPDEPYASREYLADCRKHLINTILPDYMNWPAATEPVDTILGYLRENGLKLVEGFRWKEKDARWEERKKMLTFPGLLYLYLADEPNGIKKARSMTEELNRLHGLAPDIPCKISLCELGCNMYDYTYVDDIDYAVYPVVWCSLDTVGRGIKQLSEAIAPATAGFVPQAFRWSPTRDDGGGGCRFPYPEEERLMVFSAIAAGARAINYFCYNLDTWEPVEGIGTAALIGIPEAVRLWEEIGRINLELATLGPLLSKGCVLKNEKTADGLEISQIGVGRDVIIYVITNNNYRYTRDEYSQCVIKEHVLNTDVPEYIKPKDCFEISYSGISTLRYDRNKGAVSIPLTDIKTSRLVVIAGDTGLRKQIIKRYEMLSDMQRK